eukprot:scaffold6683_cov41-Prasinocladus_malaysianus.AAC.1
MTRTRAHVFYYCNATRRVATTARAQPVPPKNASNEPWGDRRFAVLLKWYPSRAKSALAVKLGTIPSRPAVPGAGAGSGFGPGRPAPTRVSSCEAYANSRRLPAECGHLWGTPTGNDISDLVSCIEQVRLSLAALELGNKLLVMHTYILKM